MAKQTIIREQKVKLGSWPPPTRSEWHAWVTDALSQRLISRGTRGPQTEIQIIMKYYLQFHSVISTNDIGKMNHLHQIQNTNNLFTYPQPKVHSQYPTWLPQWLPHTDHSLGRNQDLLMGKRKADNVSSSQTQFNWSYRVIGWSPQVSDLIKWIKLWAA